MIVVISSTRRWLWSGKTAAHGGGYGQGRQQHVKVAVVQSAAGWQEMYLLKLSSAF